MFSFGLNAYDVHTHLYKSIIVYDFLVFIRGQGRRWRRKLCIVICLKYILFYYLLLSLLWLYIVVYCGANTLICLLFHIGVLVLDLIAVKAIQFTSIYYVFNLSHQHANIFHMFSVFSGYTFIKWCAIWMCDNWPVCRCDGNRPIFSIRIFRSIPQFDQSISTFFFLFFFCVCEFMFLPIIHYIFWLCIDVWCVWVWVDWNEQKKKLKWTD